MHSVVNKEQITAANAPEAVAFLKAYNWTGEEIEAMLAHGAANDLKADEIAKWVMTNDTFAKWKTWVEPAIATKVLAALAG